VNGQDRGCWGWECGCWFSGVWDVEIDGVGSVGGFLGLATFFWEGVLGRKLRGLSVCPYRAKILGFF